MLTPERQTEIINTIRVLVNEAEPEDRPTRCHLLFLGAYIGLGGDETPPWWQICIMSSTTERILEKTT